MNSNTMNASMLKEAFLTAAKTLEAKKEIINELNVFPVPDGDTGTNMTLTIMSAAKEVAALQDFGMKELAKAIASGSLRGARGNSGVILSQLLRGFTKVIQDHDELTIEIIADSFERAVETAYKAVMKPKEGTILTVARMGAERARELVGTTDSMEEFFSKIIEKMKEALDYTPELLPVLKEAGVVDSGGAGLLEVVTGGFDSLNGHPIPFDTEIKAEAGSGKPAARGAASDDISTADIKFGYCTEFIILLDKEFPESEEHKFKAFLESIGDSIVLVADDGVCKVHVHTNDPGAAFSRAIKYGQLTRMKIDNMREEHNERVIAGVNEILASEKSVAVETGKETKETPEKKEAPKAEEPRKKDGFVAVSIGEGLNEILTGLGVDRIIEGGQTMNPSTDDVMNAIEKVNADNVYVLPNNGNIILAAQQAKMLTTDKNVIVIPSKTIPQGISALINYMYDNSPEENEAAMTEALKSVKTGQITYAVRDTSIDGFDVKKNDIMGLDDKTIKAVGSTVEDVAFDLAAQMIDDNSELVTLYYGDQMSQEEADALANRLSDDFPSVEVEVHEGDQPIYYYIISVE
ncbi:MAG: DAK2 domain-containing protein [Lachnospiraceae bacterium]|nr:DAK2 domain-containing protein [Lachnospiraceae bacterium]